MVTTSTDPAPTNVATATAAAAPAPAGPAGNIPAAGKAPVPQPDGPKSTPELAKDAQADETAAMAKAAQDAAAKQDAAQKVAGQQAAAEVAADVPAPPPAPDVFDAPAEQIAGSSGAAILRAPPLPAVTGVGEGGITLKSRRVLVGSLAKLWTKLIEGATLAELRAESGIHDVESTLRRWEAEGLAQFRQIPGEAGVKIQARELELDDD